MPKDSSIPPSKPASKPSVPRKDNYSNRSRTNSVPTKVVKSRPTPPQK